MKLESLAIIGAALAALYFSRDGGDGAAVEAPVTPAPVTVYVPQYVPIYSPQVYQTQNPVIPSEPRVSEGVPTGSDIPICPVMTNLNRFPGDGDLLCQCPQGQIQGGNSVSMNALMWGTDAASMAWRNAFCM